MSAQQRLWRPRHASYYPLLLSGLNILEYLSAQDCALIADALDVSVNPNADVPDTERQLRTRQLADRFKRGAEG